ncbi:MAG: peptide deformylase [Gemmatimonadetes bacterium]|nr:peptide deformylase [Gemmatimonadota bacterium]
MILEIEMLGAPVLRQKAEPVEEIDDEVRALVRNMFDTMYHAEGVGLAAPQVGISKRITVLDVPADADEDHRHVIALINPRVTKVSKDTEKGVEGCLSIPGIEESVVRSVSVVVEGLSPDGEEVVIEAEGLLARALQHELDHLDGVLFLDHLSSLKRDLALRRWRKSRAKAEAGR